MGGVLMIAGKPETIFNARDFEYLVEKHMGYEAAKYFREYAEEADEEVRSAKAGENTDLASYEADLESNHRAFQDIQTEAAVITGVLQVPLPVPCKRKPQLSWVFFKKNG